MKGCLTERRKCWKQRKLKNTFSHFHLSLPHSYLLLSHSHSLSSLSSLFCFGPNSQFTQRPSIKEALTYWKVCQTSHVIHDETPRDGRESEYVCERLCTCVYWWGGSEREGEREKSEREREKRERVRREEKERVRGSVGEETERERERLREREEEGKSVATSSLCVQKQIWSEAYLGLKEGNVNKKEKALPLPLPPSPSSLSLSLFLSLSLPPLLSLSPMLTFSTLSQTQTLPPLHIITASKDRRERETYTVLKRMLTFKKRRVNVPNSLYLSFLRPPLPHSLLHIPPLTSFHVGIHCHKHLGICPSGGGILMSQLSSPSQP